MLAGELSLASSPPLLEEFDWVLRYPKLARVFLDPAGIIERVRSVADVVEPVTTLSVLVDEPDNRVLEVALEARVDAIVTGDAELLDLTSYGDIPIMSPAAFVRRHLLRGDECPASQVSDCPLEGGLGPTAKLEQVSVEAGEAQ